MTIKLRHSRFFSFAINLDSTPSRYTKLLRLSRVATLIVIARSNIGENVKRFTYLELFLCKIEFVMRNVKRDLAAVSRHFYLKLSLSQETLKEISQVVKRISCSRLNWRQAISTENANTLSLTHSSFSYLAINQIFDKGHNAGLTRAICNLVYVSYNLYSTLLNYNNQFVVQTIGVWGEGGKGRERARWEKSHEIHPLDTFASYFSDVVLSACASVAVPQCRWPNTTMRIN